MTAQATSSGVKALPNPNGEQEECLIGAGGQYQLRRSKQDDWRGSK